MVYITYKLPATSAFAVRLVFFLSFPLCCLIFCCLKYSKLQNVNGNFAGAAVISVLCNRRIQLLSLVFFLSSYITRIMLAA